MRGCRQMWKAREGESASGRTGAVYRVRLDCVCSGVGNWSLGLGFGVRQRASRGQIYLGRRAATLR